MADATVYDLDDAVAAPGKVRVVGDEKESSSRFRS
jgi:hypothetical protein